MSANNDKLRRGLYRSRKGWVLGVCRGLAEYLDFSLLWTRVIVVTILLFTGLWPIVAVYLVAAILMKPEPVIPFESDRDQEFYESYVSARNIALRRLRNSFDSLNRRIQRLEDRVVSKDFEWEQKLNNG